MSAAGVSPAAAAGSARKRRRADGSDAPLELGDSPPSSPSPAAVSEDQADGVAVERKQRASAATAAAAAAGSSALAPGASQRASVASLSSGAASSPSPSPLSPSPSSSPRPPRAAKSEASARLQAISVSLSDNGEVSQKSVAKSEAQGRKIKKAKLEAQQQQQSRGRQQSQSKRGGGLGSDDDVIVIDSEDDEEGGAEEEGEEEGEEEPETTEERHARIMHERRATGRKVAGPLPAKTRESAAGAAANGDSRRSNTGLKSVARQNALAAAAAAAAASAAASSAAAERRKSSTGAAAAAASSSSSSSAAAAAAAPVPAPRKRDNRRDKRVSGFGAWKSVHKSHIPAMTYDGYEDLATETLEAETHAAIKRSCVYEPAGIEAYHHSPWPIVRGEAESPLSLWRRVDTKYGREEHKVKAQRAIAPKEVVAFLGGRLMEQAKASKQTLDEWNQHFHMNKNWLKEFFEYPGSHSLVVSTKDHRSITSYIRSPEERDEGEGPNVKADVVFDPKGGLFFVIYFAIEPIRRGQELYCQPFLGEWHTRCHREMFLCSRVSHWYHKYLLRLERALETAGVRFDEARPADLAPALMTPEQEERFLNIPGMDCGVLPPPLPLSQSMRVVSIEDAMKYCGCEASPTARQVDLSTSTQVYIDAVGTFIPDYIDIKNPPKMPAEMADEDELGEEADAQMEEAKQGEGEAAAAASSSSAAAAAAASASADGIPAVEILGEMSRVKVDKAAVMDLLRTGARFDLVELREDFGIHSPVRHFTPPNARAFCVVATSNIPKGTFVFCYAGVITEEVVNRDSCYVYTMERDQIRRTVRSYHGPELFLDALKVGNIARFVNDNTYRVGEDKAKGCTANLETQFLFLKPSESESGSIHLGFYTTRDVSVGEELVSQYGEDYWKTINKQLIAEHRKFYDYANPYMRKLERLAVKRGVALPERPPEIWSQPGEELFEPKPRPYPQLSDGCDDGPSANGGGGGGEDSGDGDEEAFEVERILNRRVGDDGQLWYRVKWKHHSTAHNEWIPEKNVVHCHDLIAEYEASVQPGRGGGAATKSKGAAAAASRSNKKKK